MKKIKKKLLTVMLYTICWRNVDKLYNIWVYTKYNLLKRKMQVNNIKNFRKKQNLSQSDVAKIMKIKQNTVSQWENDTRIPNVRQGIKLAEILETTVEGLYK